MATDIGNEPPSAVATTTVSGTVDDGTTNATTNVLTLTHSTTGTAAAGIGTGIRVVSEDAGGSAQDVAYLRFVLTTATAGAEVGAMRIALINTTMPAEASEQYLLTPTQATVPRLVLSAAGTAADSAIGMGAAGVAAGISFPGGDGQLMDFNVTGVQQFRVTNGTFGMGSVSTRFRTCFIDGGVAGGPGGADLVFSAGTGPTAVFSLTNIGAQFKLAAGSQAAVGTGVVSAIGNTGPGTTALSVKAWFSVQNSSGTAGWIPVYMA